VASADPSGATQPTTPGSSTPSAPLPQPQTPSGPAQSPVVSSGATRHSVRIRALQPKTQTGLFPGNNNCFLNSALQQVLTDLDLAGHLGNLAKWSSVPHQPADRKAVDANKTSAACAALAQVVSSVRSGESVRSLTDLRAAIGLKGTRQEDCHEAFIRLLDCVQSQAKYFAEVRMF
jgi:hypothetical protein